MMQADCTFQTPVIYRTTQQHNPSLQRGIIYIKNFKLFRIS